VFAQDSTDKVKLYVDGSLVSGTEISAGTFSGIRSANNPVIIGKYRPGDPRWFDGRLDEVHLYSDVISVNDIQSLINASRTCRDCSVPASVAAWYLDECEWTGASGEVADSSGNGNDGTVSGGATTGDGQVCRAGFFDGNDDYITIPNASALQVAGDLTISVWIYPTNIAGGGRQSIVFKHYNNEYELIMEPNGQISFYHGDGSWEEIQEPTCIVTENTWNHVVVTRTMSDKKIRFYLNGVYQGFDDFTDTPVASNNPVLIGRRGSTSYYFEGRIDEVQIFNEALSPFHVHSLYTASRTCRDCLPDPVAAWYLDECSWDGTIGEVADSSGNGLEGTAYGGATTVSGQVCRAGQFDGVDDYVDFGDDPRLDFGTGDFTIALWKKGYTHTGRLVAKREAGSSVLGYELVDRNNRISVLIGDGTTYYHQDVGQTNINDNQWHHYALVWDASSEVVTVYLDGAQDGTATYSGIGNIDNSANLYLGRWTSGQYYQGVIDEVHIYDEALEGSDIQVLMNRTHPCQTCEATRVYADFPRQKWVLLGVPVTPSPSDALSVFGDDFDGQQSNGLNWEVARWDASDEEYDLYSASPGSFPGITPGLGFWVFRMW
jgi:hypothetical protein